MLTQNLEHYQLSGMINGRVVDVLDYNDSSSLVIYAYENGAYSADEMVPSSDGIIFENSISSADVNMTDGNFTLAFLEEGSYSLITALYIDNEFNAVVDVENNIEVLKGASILVDVNTSDN